jgi:DNA-binding SARP family transcriptional activator/predicted ATPase
MFGTLGPLEVRDGDRAIALPRRKHRVLLAVLLLRAGERVSSDVLIELLWGERPPRTARGALVNYISLLRKALGPDVLLTRDHGYVLAVDAEQTDHWRFERLCGDGRAAADAAGRAAKLREALGLWRGPPLADLAYEPFVGIEIARLEELRLAARQDLIDAELELGRHASLIPELEALIREHPFDERLRGQLMLSLYRAGRQAEALDAYQTARHVLDEELGLEPGPPLRELEQAILRQDPELRTAPAAPTAAMPLRRTVSVLFADLVDSTSLVEGLDPEISHVLLGRYFAAARAAVERHGGVVEKFIGDAVMAVFGVPQAHEDDALRAVRAGLEIRDSLTAIDERLVVRLGINTGEVLTGGAREGLVTGAAVTLAKRLEQAARGGEVLVGASTLRLVRDAVRSGRRNRPDLVAFYVNELIEGAQGLARRLDRRLVDREVELAELRRAFEAARDERCCVVCTGLGEAGIGKSRLARELVTQVRDEATVLVGRCVSYGEGATYLPLREMIGEGFDAIFDAAGSTGEVFLATRRRFEELARERALLLVFEDVHWAEPTLLGLIEYLGRQSTGAPILVLCLARPDLLAAREGWTEIGPSLVLEPLRDDDARQLIGGQPLAERIVEIAEGNPLYVEQLAAYVDEEGAEALDTVPGSIDALLASRLDRVGPEERAVAQRAAVIGRRFSPAGVAALGSVEALPGLEHAGFVHRAGTLYRFHHGLVRDVVYAGTPKAERATLHQRHADWLGAQPDGSDELVGYHLEQAVGYLRELDAPDQEVERLATNAGRRLGAAGTRAWKRGDATTAINLLRRATALLPERDPARLEWMCDLAGALRSAGELTRAEAVWSGAREEASAAGERRLELRADLEALYVGLSLDPDARASEVIEQAAAAIPFLEECRDDRSLGRAWMIIAEVQGPYYLHYLQAGEAARRALLHYRRAGWPFSACLGMIAAALYYGPTAAPDAVSACTELLAEADLNGQAAVLPYLGGLEAMSGDFEQARSRVAQSRKMYRELGQALAAEFNCSAVESEIEQQAGSLTRARNALESSCIVLSEHRERAYLATRQATLADVLYRQGQLEEAARYSRAARSGATSDDVVTQRRWRSVDAKLAARGGRFRRAEQLARDAIGLLADTDFLNGRAICLLDLGEVLMLAGLPAEATTTIEEALALFKLKGNAVAADRTRLLLAEMAESP